MTSIDIAVEPAGSYPYHRRTTLLGEMPMDIDCGSVGRRGPVLRFAVDRHGNISVGTPGEHGAFDVVYGEGRSPLLGVDVPGFGTVSVMVREGCP